MIRIAMLSKWHVHARDYARQVRGSKDACLAAVWDDDADRGQAWAAELEVDFEADLDRLLARQDIDAVIVDTPTTDHARVMVAAARAGKHIFTEKAMAPTLAECRQISAAVLENQVKFCISYPQLTHSWVQFARQALDQGLLGHVHYFRYRNAHAGTLHGWLPEYWYDVDKAAGGAMMDLGCHPMYIAAYLLGQPRRIASMFNTSYCPPPAEDHAVSVVEFANKTIAVLETSFISPWSGDCIELLGTEGAIVTTEGKLKIRSNHYPVSGWVIPDQLPDPSPMPLQQWLEGIRTGSPITYDTRMGEALTQLLENAYLSDKQQAIISIQD